MTVLHLGTLDTVFLIITACAIILFFLLAATAAAMAIMIVSKVKKVVAKAESVIDSVEEASEALKNLGGSAKGPFAALRVIKSIIELVNKHK